MSGVFQEPVVRIWSADVAPVGTGVLVQGTGIVYLLTCAHVVNVALGGGRFEAEQERPGLNDLVLFDVPGRSVGTTRHAARVVEWFAPVKAQDRTNYPVSDIALLEVLGGEGNHAPLPGSLRLVHPEDFDFVEDDDIIGRREIKGFGFARENGGFASGQITGSDANGWLHLVGTDDRGDFIEPGFSGAPLFDVGRSTILGMAVAVDGDRNRRLAFLQSTRNIWKACPQIARPYRGLRPFEEEDAPFFFGRDAFVLRMLDKAKDFAILGVSAASGAGKSSALRAGLLPRLKAGDLKSNADGDPVRCLALIMRPGDDPWKELARAIALADKPSATLVELVRDTKQVQTLLRDDPSALKDYARVLLTSRDADRLVIVVDQFEELFTTGGHGQDAGDDDCSATNARGQKRPANAKSLSQARADFRDLIVATATLKGKPAIQWLYALRADFADRAFAHRGFADAVGDGNEFLAPMTPEELRRSIGQPATELKVDFQGGTDRHPGLLERITSDTALGALPLMQHVLEQLWKRLKGRVLEHAPYDQLGGVLGALSQHAEAIYKQLSAEEQKFMPSLFSRLVNVKDDGEATRRIARRSELSKLVAGVGEDRADEKLWELALKLADEDSRLLTITSEAASARQGAGGDNLSASDATRLGRGLPLANDPTVEVAHEALLRSWDRLKGWISDDSRFIQWRQSFQNKLREHTNAKDKQGTWLSGGPLQEALGYASTRPQNLTDQERNFITRSDKVQTEILERDRKRAEDLERALSKATKRTRFAATAAVFLLVALGAAWWQWDIAQENERTANQTRDQAEIDASRYAAAVSLQLSDKGQFVDAVRIARSNLADKFSDSELSREMPAFAALSRAVSGIEMDPGILRAHAAPVVSAMFSPDGTRIVSASEDDTARLWDTATGKQIGGPMIHQGDINTAAFSPDGTRIVTASSDMTARLWDAATGRPIGEPMRHAGIVNFAAFSPDGSRIVTASNDTTARLWDAATGWPIGESLQHEESVNTANFSPDGSYIVTASLDNTARLWDATTSRPIGEAMLHQNTVNKVAVSPDGTRIVTASWGNTAQLWDVTATSIIGEPMEHDFSVISVAFSPDGTRVVTASDDGGVRLWDATNGTLIGEPMRHEGPVRSAVFSPDGTRIVTASSDNTARQWDSGAGTQVGEVMQHDKTVNSAVFSPDGTRIVTASDDNTARLWNAATGRPVGEIKSFKGFFGSVAFSTDGARVVTTSDDNAARLWDAATGRQIGEPMQHKRRVTYAAFSPDGTRIVTASDDRAARLWDAATGGQTGEAIQDEFGFNSALFSPDGTFIVTSSDDSTARLWNVATGTLVGEPMRHENSVSFAAFSPDGTRIVTASSDNTAWVWNNATGTPIGEPMRHEDSVNFAAFSPDGTRIVTASSDKTARLWDAATGRPIGEPMQHDYTVRSAVFSPDGSRVLTSCGDGMPSATNFAQLWDAATSTLTGEAMRHNDTVMSAVFSANGTRILTASWNGSVHQWNVSPALPTNGSDGAIDWSVQSPFGQELLDRADQLVPFPLTQEDRRVILQMTNSSEQVRQ